MTLTLSNAPLPIQDAIARTRRKQFEKVGKDPLEGLITDPWVDYFNAMVTTIDAAATRLARVSKASQFASIAATDFSGGTLGAGMYEIKYYVRVTRAAGVSSSIQVTLDWTDGVAQTFTGTALTGNTATTWESDSKPIVIDGGTPVRYATTYASVGAPVMLYKLEIALMRLDA